MPSIILAVFFYFSTVKLSSSRYSMLKYEFPALCYYRLWLFLTFLTFWSPMPAHFARLCGIKCRIMTFSSKYSFHVLFFFECYCLFPLSYCTRCAFGISLEGSHFFVNGNISIYKKLRTGRQVRST